MATVTNTAGLYSLREMYLNDPSTFESTLESNNATSRLWKQVISDIVTSVQAEYLNISYATIAQIDMDGNPIFLAGDSEFADTKNDIKQMPGSVSKFKEKYILIADPIKKQALILQTGFTNIKSVLGDPLSLDDEAFFSLVFENLTIGIYDTIFQYQSDKYIVDFELANSNLQVDVRDGLIDNNYLTVRQGDVITWTNNSTSPIIISSGTTNYELFYSSPDLSLYGDTIQSPSLQCGESFSYTVTNNDSIDWFVYPSILTGKITVTEEINIQDMFFIIENDGYKTPFSSRLIKIDYYGNVLSSFGESYIINPRKIQTLNNNNVLAST